MAKGPRGAGLRMITTFALQDKASVAFADTQSQMAPLAQRILTASRIGVRGSAVAPGHAKRGRLMEPVSPVTACPSPRAAATTTSVKPAQASAVFAEPKCLMAPRARRMLTAPVDGVRVSLQPAAKGRVGRRRTMESESNATTRPRLPLGAVITINAKPEMVNAAFVVAKFPVGTHAPKRRIARATFAACLEVSLGLLLGATASASSPCLMGPGCRECCGR
mmetsp:Transcript_61475/g.114968  ORF Transcript_61475/g.114968 Transcript_61475/m.114968 type:complete len:221 (+) Transcript_61475:177-839(+)